MEKRPLILGDNDEMVAAACRLPTQWEVCPYVGSPDEANLDPYTVPSATKMPTLRLFLTNTDTNLLDLSCNQLPLGAMTNINLTPNSRQPYARANANLTPSLCQNYANMSGNLTPLLRQPLLNIAENIDPAYASL